MTSVLSLMVLILIDGTEDRHLMTSHHCRRQILAVREVIIRHPNVPARTTSGVEIVEFQCRPWKMEAQS